MKPLHDITVILEDIRSALNVGAIFRTSDGASINKLYLTGITPYPPHNRIPKTALGAIDTVVWEYKKDTMECVKQIVKDRPILAIEITPEAVAYSDYDFPEPVAIVMGNEISGISKNVLSLCTATIKIPMYGSKESLNVATAYGIIIYEIVRQYNVRINNAKNNRRD